MTLAETLPLPPNQIIRRYLVSVCIAFEFICDSKCARLSLVYIWCVLVTFQSAVHDSVKEMVISDGSMNCGMPHKDMWPGLPMTWYASQGHAAWAAHDMWYSSQGHVAWAEN